MSIDVQPASLTTTTTASPTPELEFTLAEGVNVVLEMKSGVGEWSPTGDRFAFLSCDSSQNIVRLTVHEPADFSPHELFSQVIECEPNFLDLSWRPDGKQIVFTGSEQDDRGLHDHAQTWVSDLNSSRILLEPDNRSWFTQYHGWMSGNVLIKSKYAGGGSQVLEFVDVVQGRRLGGAFFVGNYFGGNAKYIPIGHGKSALMYRLVALTAFDHFDIYEYVASGETGGVFFPIDEKDTNTVFMDWRGETNTMLVLLEEHNPDNHAFRTTQLLFWDVDRNEILLEIPNAVYGEISTDGRWLAYLASGFESPSTDLLELEYCSESDINRELRIMDLWVQEDVAAFPVEVWCGSVSSYPNFSGDFEFSPDGSKIAIRSIPSTDHEPDPVGLIRFVNLETLDSIIELTGRDFSWSRDGSSLLYQDADRQYEIFDLDSGAGHVIIDSLGQGKPRFEWSLTGKYIGIYYLEYYGLRHLIIVQDPTY
jgi:dipeptidyl aminopeptidase/acylaminoacyl peptidase